MKSRFEIRILNSAEEDIDAAFEYYSDINPKLGKRFIKLLNASFNDLKINPNYQIRYDNFRMKLVRKFPYIIHYVLDDKRCIVYVYGVRNSYQNPANYPRE